MARREFLQLVSEQRRSGSSTVLFSSHLVDEVERLADRLGIIDEGVMQFEGPLPELSRQVRRLRGVTEIHLGSPFEILRKSSDGYILRCQDAQAFEELPRAYPDALLESLQLEDTFIEMVTRQGRPKHASL